MDTFGASIAKVHLWASSQLPVLALGHIRAEPFPDCSTACGDAAPRKDSATPIDQQIRRARTGEPLGWRLNDVLGHDGFSRAE